MTTHLLPVPAARFVAAAERYTNTPYILGAEHDTDPGFTPARALDCSELVTAALGDVGHSFAPDGHWNQWSWCRRDGQIIPVAQAISTPGALLFVYDGTPIGHVAISRGDGSTIEARGRAWGTGSWSAYGRGWTHGALVPGVDYTHAGGGEWDMDEAQMQRFAALIADAIVTRLMGHPILLSDTKTHPLENVIGYTNDNANATIERLDTLIHAVGG